MSTVWMQFTVIKNDAGVAYVKFVWLIHQVAHAEELYYSI